ncbi:glycosyltransferase family 1 protein [soil metagenome]
MSSGSAMQPDQPIYIDASALFDSHITGIGRFVARMIEAVGQTRPVILFTTASRPSAAASEQGYLHWGAEIFISQRDMDALDPIDVDVAEWAKKIVRLPRRKSDLEKMKQCAAVYPLLRPMFRAFRKEIGVFYDFTPQLLPWTHASTTIHHFGLLFGVAAQLHDAVIAISQSTSNDAKWLSSIDHDRIVTAYPGPSQCCKSHAHSVQIREKIILVVSSIEPRKNASFLLKWFLETEAIEPGTELWWAGAKGWWASDEDAKHLESSGNQNNRPIRFLGPVSDSEICRLYQSAMLTIYPSLYEGFGFPVLDSLWHGTPVITSFNSSLAEFDGEGVFFCDPYAASTLDDAYRNFLRQRDSIEIPSEALGVKYRWENVAAIVNRLAQ